MVDESWLKDFELREDGKYQRKGKGVGSGNDAVRVLKGDVSSEEVPLNREGGIWIHTHVPSKKNSKRILYKTLPSGRKQPFISSSKLVKKYESITKLAYQSLAKEFKEQAKGKTLPLIVQLTFVRSTKQRFDFINIAQLVCDLMQEYKWIEDDDMTNLIVIPPLTAPFYYVDKYNPGVLIKIL